MHFHRTWAVCMKLTCLHWWLIRELLQMSDCPETGRNMLLYSEAVAIRDKYQTDRLYSINANVTQECAPLPPKGRGTLALHSIRRFCFLSAFVQIILWYNAAIALFNHAWHIHYHTGTGSCPQCYYVWPGTTAATFTTLCNSALVDCKSAASRELQ